MNNQPVPSPMISLNSLEGRMAKTAFFLSWLWEGIWLYKSLPKALSAFKELMIRRKIFHGDFPARKAARVGNKFYWALASPGFPSPQSRMHQAQMLHLALPHGRKPGIQAVFFSITNKCALQCTHCYAWNELRQKEQLTRDDLLAVVKKFQEFGACLFFFEGGEPLLRFKDLIFLLREAHRRSACWIITSGYHLTPEKAQALKNAGLTGVMISLDHHVPELHDQFRGKAGTFQQAAQAVENANRAGLITALSLCATRAFTREENMSRYMDLARNWRVSFVQILEPRAKGRYAGLDVALFPAQRQLLEEAFVRYNSQPVFDEYPLIFYPAFHQRRGGCMGAGQSYLYIGSDGRVAPCPFCEEKTANALHLSAEELIAVLQKCGCGASMQPPAELASPQIFSKPEPEMPCGKQDRRITAKIPGQRQRYFNPHSEISFYRFFPGRKIFVNTLAQDRIKARLGSLKEGNRVHGEKMFVLQYPDFALFLYAGWSIFFWPDAIV